MTLSSAVAATDESRPPLGSGGDSGTPGPGEASVDKNEESGTHQVRYVPSVPGNGAPGSWSISVLSGGNPDDKVAAPLTTLLGT